MRFRDKVVIVTGGASGLGEATVLEFVKEGAKVSIADISDNGQAFSEELNSKGYDTIFVKTDVSKEDEIKNLVSKTVEKYGKLDVMFANAGINIEADVHNLDLKTWHKVLDVNLTSVFLSDKYAIEQFQKQGTGGVIINTGSIHSLVARDGLVPYSASKGGIKMLTQQVAARYSKEGIRANAIAPGYIETPLMNTLSQDVIDSLVGLHPMGRLGKPVEVAKTVLFLASDDSSFISGVTLPIDGGYTAV
ncbi:MAG TPA: 3-oxoacyl-ACP reductase [Bacillus bacterium]|uniref:Short-chain dehydrogenase n=1 Tax=Siminovitchia fordii TaxID=254759 RepID=A0ABQ4K866_9BACI|nr:glucose 1-dehydrogenase [Siminovitchia fordii]GIN21375.1 short-chain dehydrogenase [Siminovitchia fordii]HBZ10565.1 3-oxoacyl-ACP reductase [Bacillus sp. (in: firmicutes)]